MFQLSVRKQLLSNVCWEDSRRVHAAAVGSGEGEPAVPGGRLVELQVFDCLSNCVWLWPVINQDLFLKKMEGNCTTAAQCLDLMDRWSSNTERFWFCFPCQCELVWTWKVNWRLLHDHLVFRSTSLTSMFQERSASRSRRHWVQETNFPCLKHVSVAPCCPLCFRSALCDPPVVVSVSAFCKVGVGICYDMRFAELAQIYSRNGETERTFSSFLLLKVLCCCYFQIFSLVCP